MKKLFDQSRGSTAHTTNMLSLARSFGLHDSEVVYAKVGTKLVNVKGIYDGKTATFWLLPELTGSEIFSFTAPMLVTDKETIDLTEHNLKFENYHIKYDYSFDTGFELKDGTQAVNFDDYLYRWDGELPKLVPASSTPESTGGIDIGKWINIGNSSTSFKYAEVAKDIGDSYNDGTVIIAKHGFTVGDYAGGVFRYYKNRNLQDDGGVVINTGVIGQLVRDGVKGNRYPGALNVLWYGAVPDDPQFDNSIPFNKALSSSYSNSVYLHGGYFVKNQIFIKSRKSLLGEPSCWAYSDSGFNLTSTIKLSTEHTIPYGKAIIDAKRTKQTCLSYIDVDGSGGDVLCVEYGYRVGEESDVGYNNHEIESCVFRHALIGVRADYAGLMRVNNTQFTNFKEYGIYSELTLSDSTFTSCYWNDIGYHNGLPDPSDHYNSVGAAIALGPHSGTAFIGGKIEWCRVGFHCIGTSALRVVGMWMDVFKQAAFRFIGSNQGAGESNIIQGVVINGAGWSTANGAAVEVHGDNTNMNVSFNGTITGSDESLSSNKESPTYGPKLAGIKVLNNKGVVTVGGDLINCSKSYSTYADGGSRIIDTATSNLPNVVAGLSVRNGYRYDAGSLYRGLILRDIPDHTPHNYGVEIGAMYRVGDAVYIRTE